MSREIFLVNDYDGVTNLNLLNFKPKKEAGKSKPVFYNISMNYRKDNDYGTDRGNRDQGPAGSGPSF